MTEPASPNGRPSISVITVCFNAAATIETTLRSVAAQTYAAVEQIVVDGGSTDGTLEVVRRHARPDAKVVSEKDDGIFDAMNKGIALATGDIVYFLNADDSFVDERVLADVARAFDDPSRMLVWGDIVLKDATAGMVAAAGRPFRTRSISEFLHNSFCHQAVFARRGLFDRIGSFDERYRFSADYEWIARAFKANAGHDFFYLDRPIANYFALGRSRQHVAVTYREVNRIRYRHFASPEYFWFFFRYVWVRRLKKRLLREPGWLLD